MRGTPLENGMNSSCWHRRKPTPESARESGRMSSTRSGGESWGRRAPVVVVGYNRVLPLRVRMYLERVSAIVRTEAARHGISVDLTAGIPFPAAGSLRGFRRSPCLPCPLIV